MTVLFEVGSFRFYIIWFCIIVGLFDYGIMMMKSRGSYKYSKYRQNRLDDMKEWLEDYSNGIFPTLGCVDETWSYGDKEYGYFIVGD